MKILDRFTKRFTASASSAVKEEVKKTAIDLVPTLFNIAAAIVGIVIFRGMVNNGSNDENYSSVSHTNVVTNNYFFRDLSEESIQKIIEDK